MVLLCCVYEKVYSKSFIINFRLTKNLDYPFRQARGTVEVGRQISLTLNTLKKSILPVFYCFYFMIVLFTENCLITYSRNAEGDSYANRSVTSRVLPCSFTCHFLFPLKVEARRFWMYQTFHNIFCYLAVTIINEPWYAFIFVFLSIYNIFLVLFCILY